MSKVKVNPTQVELHLADYEKFQEKLFGSMLQIKTPPLLWENSSNKNIVIKVRSLFDDKSLISNKIIVTGTS